MQTRQFDLRRRVAVLAVVLMSGAAVFPAHAQDGAAKGKAETQTLRGAAAQKSPQADAFIAYENALIDGGLDAASKYASPAKVQENQEMVKAFGIEGFRQMQAAKRAARVPAAERRKQIEKVEITGDYAVLEARTERKGVLDEAAFLKTVDGWKVTPVRR
jgi:hypothetical protein